MQRTTSPSVLTALASPSTLLVPPSRLHSALLPSLVSAVLPTSPSVLVVRFFLPAFQLHYSICMWHSFSSPLSPLVVGIVCAAFTSRVERIPRHPNTQVMATVGANIFAAVSASVCILLSSCSRNGLTRPSDFQLGRCHHRIIFLFFRSVAPPNCWPSPDLRLQSHITRTFTFPSIWPGLSLYTSS